ncbi:fumarylacetoacetate hydrolase family protein [Streptomyces sp. NPDC059467]|uniref:fumarylacetoacetate hydrolase family protein n=1 Tax=Streptomyces sp. NPDC059467 TaxID=3346844 RepID=UPI003681A2E1
MKLVTFDGGPDYGLVGRLDGDTVVELEVPSTRAYFEREGQVGETGRTFALADVRLRAPIAPKKFFHTAGNFREHHEDLVRVDWSHPVNKGIVFFQNVDAVIGPDEPIVYPANLTRELDYELELAIVIGKPGRFFSAEQAVEHIAGYVIFNDITARDIQRKEMESGVFSFSKAIETFCPIGPYIVTADEIDDPHALDMELRVNGDVRQKSNTGRMSVSIPQLVAYHSPQTYSPGDLITTGTIAGVAASTEDPFANYLKPGDVVEAEIEGLGVLRNPVVSWREAYGEDEPSAEMGVPPRVQQWGRA